MKAEIETIPVENKGIEITSENEEEKQFLESLWTNGAAALAFTRNDDKSVTMVIGPTRVEK